MPTEGVNRGTSEDGRDDASERGTESQRARWERSLADAGISRRQLLGAAGAAVAGSAIAANVSGASEPGGEDTGDTDAAIVVLDLEPLARHPGDQADHAEDLRKQRAAFKEWMAGEAPRAEVTYEYETVLNGLAVRLNGHSVDTLRKGPDVRYVAVSQPVYPTLGESLDLIGADDAQGEYGEDELPGEGVKVAIIDTGTEHDHEDDFFRDDGFDAPEEGEWPAGNGDEWGFDEGDFTNDKVIAAYVFWDEDEDLDPGDEHSHGTHVAGIAAGREETTTDLGAVVSGVAPGAWLGNYNVFAGGTPTAEENVIAAVEQAVEDGFDVINMSLGGPIDEPEDPLMEASENAVAAGVVVVSSAGNSGPDSETITSPAAAPNVTAVGASSNDWGIFEELHVTEKDGDEAVSPVAYLPGVDGGEIDEEILDTPIVAWQDLDTGSTTDVACDGPGNPSNLPELNGEVVLVQRGDCTFAEKAENIKEAGGSAMIVYNRDDADPEELVTMTLQNNVTFPSAFIRNVDGCRILDLIRGGNGPHVDITFEEGDFDHSPNLLADFSSRGPGPELEIKPEITAPGVDIYSSVIDGGWATFSGTSMASPHVAGSAALVAGLEPDWFPLDHEARTGSDVLRMRSALVNSAALAVGVRDVVDPLGENCDITVDDENDPGPMGRGNGLLQVGDAVNIELLTDPATVSFGEVASNGPPRRTTAERNLTIENVSDDTVDVDVSIDGQSELTPNVAVSESGLELAAGESKSVTLTADATGQEVGNYWGQVQIEKDGKAAMTIPFWYRVSR